MNEPTHCPKCNFDLRGEDIYQHFLTEYSKGLPTYARSVEEILKGYKDYPELYKNCPTEEELRQMSNTELAAWNSAQMYGWRKENPKCFRKEIGIEIRGVYDGIIVWMCPNCKHRWKRFDWVDDKYLTE